MNNETLTGVATVGTFDGLHKGHRAVLDKVMETARRRNLSPVVFTFNDHPLDVINPSRVPGRLMDKDTQQQELSRLGFKVITMQFNEEIRNMSAYEFMKMLRDSYKTAILVVGYDNRFGRNREAGFEEYEDYGQKLGMGVIRADEVDGISSSIIRKFIQGREIEKANSALGYEYTLRGRVEHGAALGTKIGFPTANLVPADNRRLIPADGTYAAHVVLPDNTIHGAMVNIGHRPTVNDGRESRSIEANIFDFKGNLYDQEITVRFVAFLRKERKMQSLDELKNQLSLDREASMKILSNKY